MTAKLTLLGWMIAAACYAQGDRGLLTGIVRDPSGAPIAGAAIRAVHVATNVASNSETNADGNYSLGFLLPGEYTVTANKSGFRQFERTGVRIAVNDRLTLNVAMEIGQVNEKMQVNAEAPLLETTSSSMGTLIDHRRLTELPLYYGNPMMLQFQAPGITWNAPLHYQAPWDTSGASQSSINGSQMQSIDFQVDGLSNNRRNNNVAYVPSVEFVQEYKVETLAYDASEGHGSAWVNASLKSGTNALHGSVYTYIQNKNLNANGFFSNLAGQPKGDFDYMRWQASAGGPLIKNKTFWFAGIERIRPGSTTRRIFTVPTVAEKNGDFSALLPLGSQYQIYDPWTTTNLNNGRYSRTPFAGNVIPQSRITTIAKNILKYYPDPNDAPSPTREGLNNYIYKEGYNQNNYMSMSARIDHNFNDSNRLFGRFGLATNTLNENGYDFAKGASAGHTDRKSPLVALDYTHIFTAATVLDVRYGYTRSYDGTISNTAGFDLSTLGFPKSLADQLWFKQYPSIGFGSNSYTTTNIINPSYAYGSINSVIAAVSRTQGRHFLRVGVDYRDSLNTSGSHTGEGGVFNFNGGYMNGPLDNSPTPPLVASSLGGLLLGLSTNSYVNRNASYAGVVHTSGLYFQDDWKLSDRLTLNLGLRYEYESAPVERYDRAVRGFDYNTSSPVEAAAKAAYALSPVPELPVSQFQVKGGLTFLGVNGQPRSLYDAPSRNFMPRFGFAYSPNSKTVVRGGYGIFFGQLGLTVRNFNQTGFSSVTNNVPTLDNGETFISTLANPFPTGLLNPIGAGDGIATNLGQNISFQNTKLRTPYDQRWSFGIQRILPAGFLIDTGYVGNRSTGLETSRSLNYTPGEYLSTSPVRDQAVIDRLSRNLPNPMAGLLPGTSLNGANVSLGRLLYAYPQFGSVGTSTSQGYSWYHSLQTRIERRFSSGYTILGAWTWSKNMEATSFLNAFDRRPEEVISAQDRPHRVTMSGIYELPFGRGKHFLANASRPVKAVVDGWQLSGNFQYQIGEPLGLGDYIYYGDPTQIVLPRSERNRDHWFNTAGFETNTAKQRSNAVRYISSRFSGLRAAPINVLDLSAIKKAKIRERLSFELRVEALSALNHQIFDVPNTAVTAGTFGTVTANKAFSNRRMQIALYLRF
jgi:hypothetical protein